MILGDFESPETVKRSIDSVIEYVDKAYITVTYKKTKPRTNKKLIKLLNSYSKIEVSFFKWTFDFAEARNFALDQVPKGERVFIYWHDADDRLEGGENLRKIVDDMMSYNQSGVYLDYLYQVELDEEDQVRNILVEHKRERVIRNNYTWKWIGGLHETLIEQKQENLIRVVRHEARVVHLTDNERLDHNIDRNIEILENMVRKEKRQDPRTLVYLGKAYLDKGRMFHNTDEPQKKIMLDMALELFREYLQGEGRPGDEYYRLGSGFREERAGVWAHIAEIAILQQNPPIAVNALQEAINEAPEFPEFYADLSLAYVSMGDFKKAKQWLNIAAATPEPETSIVRYPQQLKKRALEASFQINLHENKLDNCLQDLQMVKQLSPQDKVVDERIKMVEGLSLFNQACQSVVFLGKYLENVKEEEKLPYLIKAIPSEVQKEKFASEMRHRFLPPKKWESNEMAIICGPGVGQWSPKSIGREGLGGSEEAVVHLSSEMVKLGWKVTVYANPSHEAGIYDGVTYEDWFQFNPKDEFNVLISWRMIGLADIKPKAKYHLVWLHDVPNNADFTPERVSTVNKIAVLSEYHKSLLRFVDSDGKFIAPADDKVFVTANGIPEMPEPEGKRDPHKMVYISSPDRGLVYLLKNWASVIKEVPDATLDVYYGFETFDILHRGNPSMQAWKSQMMAMMNQPGIKYFGRVNHTELHKVLGQAGIWAYPTDFEEISCISAMKAQAMGSVPVTTDYAALKETVKNGIKIDINIRKEAGQKEYFEALITALKSDSLQNEMRPNMMNWARENLGWNRVAQDWDTEFRVHLANPEKKYELSNKFKILDSAPIKEK